MFFSGGCIEIFPIRTKRYRSMDRNLWTSNQHRDTSSSHPDLFTTLVAEKPLMDRGHPGRMRGGSISFLLACGAHPEFGTLTLLTAEMATDGPNEMSEEDREPQRLTERQTISAFVSAEEHTHLVSNSPCNCLCVCLPDQVRVSAQVGVSV